MADKKSAVQIVFELAAKLKISQSEKMSSFAMQQCNVKQLECEVERISSFLGISRIRAKENVWI